MKNRYLTLLTLSLLVFSLLGPANAQPEPSIFQTGDEFTFTGDGTADFVENRYFSIIDSNTNDPLRLEIENRQTNEIVETLNDLTSFTDIDSPFGVFPVVIQSQTDRNIVSGTYSEDRREFDANRVGDEWNNHTFTDDLSGQYWYDESFQPIDGNATYAVIFPEMNSMTLPAPFYLPIPMEETTFTFPDAPDATLVDRSVTSGSDTFNINEADHTISYTNVTSEFNYNLFQNFTWTIPFGPIDDPDTPYITLNASADVSMTMKFEHLFDTDTGMLIQENRMEYYSTEVLAWGDNVTIPTPEGGEFVADVYHEISFNDVFDEGSSLSSISMLYGETRPTSSGENRLQEGDTLQYIVDGRNRMSVDDGFNTYDFGGDIEGMASIDVFYHENNFFKGVFQLEAQFFHDSTMALDNHENQDDLIFELEILESPSNDSYEIYPFIEENLHIDTPEINLPTPRGLSTDDHEFGGIYIEDITIPLADVVEYTEFVDFTVNGFDYVIVANYIEGIYSISDTTTYFSEYFNSEIEVVLNGEGTISMAYDPDTGVLLERSEDMDITIEVTPLIDNAITTTVVLEDKFDLTLQSHPHFYNEAQTDAPDINDTSSDGTPTNESIPGLDLPFTENLVPIVGSLAFVTIFIRRRRRY